MMPALGECFLGVRSAAAFLTRIPMGMGSQRGQRWAAAHFPLVGGFIGALGAVIWVAAFGVDPTTRAWLVLAALLLVTGAFHEDGLADTADALGGAYTRERLFAILKDSRIGTFGAAALVVALALRAALMSRVLAESACYLIASQAVSRLGPVLLMRVLPYVTPTETSRTQHVVHAKGAQCAIAAGWTLCSLLAVLYWTHLSLSRLALGLGALAVVTTWLAWRFARRAGGITGDFLGATQQLGELAFLLGLSVCRP